MVTETKLTHTPGPWSFDPESEFDDTVAVKSEETIVACVWPMQEQFASNDPVSIANGKLIAAAPELLETLRDLLMVTGIACNEPTEDDQEVIDRANDLCVRFGV